MVEGDPAALTIMFKETDYKNRLIRINAVFCIALSARVTLPGWFDIKVRVLGQLDLDLPALVTDQKMGVVGLVINGLPMRVAT